VTTRENQAIAVFRAPLQIIMNELHPLITIGKSYGDRVSPISPTSAASGKQSPRRFISKLVSQQFARNRHIAMCFDVF